MSLLTNLMIAGGVRCGTTWIAANLRLHPDTRFHQKKEAHFFDRPVAYNQGIKYYQSLFPPDKGQSIRVDVTPTCFSNVYTEQNIPELIKAHNPNMKFIISLRNPAERVVSQYWHARSKWPEYKKYNLRELLSLRPEFIKEGYYIDHINQYLKYFPKENFHFVIFEDIVKDPNTVLGQICKFLDIDVEFTFPLSLTRINSAYSKKNEGNFWGYWYLHRFFYKMGLFKFSTFFERLNWDEKPEQDFTTMNWLINDIYCQKNMILQKFLNRDLSNWLVSNGEN